MPLPSNRADNPIGVSPRFLRALTNSRRAGARADWHNGQGPSQDARDTAGDQPGRRNCRAQPVPIRSEPFPGEGVRL